MVILNSAQLVYMRNKKCYNCKHGGGQFKIARKTHLHCEHPKYTQEDFENGKISPWDTLFEFWHTCNDYEPKKKHNQYKSAL
jgi:hypothetical protein